MGKVVVGGWVDALLYVVVVLLFVFENAGGSAVCTKENCGEQGKLREGKGMRDETKQESRRKEECVFIVEEKK